MAISTAPPQNWHAMLKGGKKKKGKAQAASAPGEEGAAQEQARLGAALAAACGRLAEALQACGAELEAAGKGVSDMDKVVAGLKVGAAWYADKLHGFACLWVYLKDGTYGNHCTVQVPLYSSLVQCMHTVATPVARKSRRGEAPPAKPFAACHGDTHVAAMMLMSV